VKRKLGVLAPQTKKKRTAGPRGLGALEVGEDRGVLRVGRPVDTEGGTTGEKKGAPHDSHYLCKTGGGQWMNQ